MWMSTEETCVALHVSARTLRRRCRAGEFESRRQGRSIQINVPDGQAMAGVIGVGRQLADVGAAQAVQGKVSADTLAGVMAAFEAASTRAERVETRALRVVALTVGLAAVGVIGVILAAGWVGLEYREEVIVHAVKVGSLKATVARMKDQVQEVDQQVQAVIEERDALALEIGVLTADRDRLGLQLAVSFYQNGQKRDLTRFASRSAP